MPILLQGADIGRSKQFDFVCMYVCVCVPFWDAFGRAFGAKIRKSVSAICDSDRASNHFCVLV